MVLPGVWPKSRLGLPTSNDATKKTPTGAPRCWGFGVPDAVELTTKMSGHPGKEGLEDTVLIKNEPDTKGNRSRKPVPVRSTEQELDGGEAEAGWWHQGLHVSAE